MKINYTSKKFFKKYVYKLVFEVNATRPFSRYFGIAAELNSIPRWIEQNLANLDCKITNRYQSGNGNDVKYHQVVYLNDDTAKHCLQQQFAVCLIDVWQPLDQSHASELEIRNLLTVRNSLLFNKYKMAVYFKYDRRGEVYTWLRDYFASSNTAKVSGDSRWPRLYLNDDGEIAVIKLSWPDSIDYVKRVILINNK